MAKAQLPDVLPGHWTTRDGLEKAKEYAAMTRENLALSDRTDLALANALYLADGFLPIQTAAKERMRWLSVQLAIANAQLAEAWAEIPAEPTPGVAPFDGDFYLVAITGPDIDPKVHEAYFAHQAKDPEDRNWWFASTAPSDYASNPIHEMMHGRATHWRRKPAFKFNEGANVA